MANDVSINVTGQDVSGVQTLRNVQDEAKKTQRTLADTAEGTDRLDTASSGLTSSLGALGSGFELVGLPNYQAGLEGAALATDFFSGVGEIATVAMTHLKDGVGTAVTKIKGFGAAIADGDTKTGKFARTAAVAAGSIALFVGGLQAVSAAFGTDLNPNVDELSNSLQVYSRGGALAGEATRLWGDDLKNLHYDLGTLNSTVMAKTGNATAGFIESITGTGKLMDQSLQHAQERIASLDQAMAQLVQSGHAEEAAAAYSKLQNEAKELGINTEELNAGLPTFIAAQARAARMTTENAKAHEDLNVQLKEYDDRIKGEIDPLFALLDAQNTVTDAQKAYNDAIKEHGKKSPEAAAALRDLGKAAAGVSGAVAGAADQLQGEMTPELYNTLKAAGLTKQQIRDLAKQFDNAREKGNSFAKTYTATLKYRVQTITIDGEANAATHGFREHASGGAAGGTVKMNERGGELVRLPNGSIVYPTGQSANMMGQGGGVANVALSFDTGGDPLLDAFVKMIRARVRIDAAGDSQAYFGQTG